VSECTGNADEEQKPIGFIALAEEPGGEKHLMQKNAFTIN
jgi:hypothetical protein